MDKSTFVFQTSWLDGLSHLGNRQIGRLVRAVCRYVEGNKDERFEEADMAVERAFRFIVKDIEDSLRCSDIFESSLSYDIRIPDSERARLLEILFFDRRVKNAVVELERFWCYYEARGWRDGKGSPILNKAALLRNWIVGDDCGRLSKRFTICYKKIYDEAKVMLQYRDGADALFLITGFYGYHNDGCDFEMSVSPSLHNFIENNISVFGQTIRTMIGAAKLTYKVERIKGAKG